MELPAWKLQGFSAKPVKTLQYAAADLQGMDALRERSSARVENEQAKTTFFVRRIEATP